MTVSNIESERVLLPNKSGYFDQVDILYNPATFFYLLNTKLDTRKEQKKPSRNHDHDLEQAVESQVSQAEDFLYEIAQQMLQKQSAAYQDKQKMIYS